jgi:cytosine/adenosine deaminase-related metal-dependent hydrolase
MPGGGHVGPGSAVDLLIEDAVILTLQPARPLIAGGSVAVRGKEILDVGPAPELAGKYTAATRIDGRDKLLTPGLINLHTHTSGALSRGMINDLAFPDWIQKKLHIAGRGLDEETYGISTMLLCLEMLKTGTTCFLDCGTVPGLEGAAARAVEEIGIKAVLGRTLVDDPALDVRENLARAEDFVLSWNGAAEGRIQAWLSPARISRVSDELSIGAKELADKHGVGICTHASVAPEDVDLCLERFGTTPIERYHRLHCLGPNFVGTHLGWITEKEANLLQATGSSVAHAPSASMKCAYGSLSRGRFPELLAMGVNVGLGSDGPSASSFQDMVRVMHLAAVGHKEARLDPVLVTPMQAVEMATVNNARAILWEDRVGSIEKGKRADMVLFDLMRPEWVPWNEKNIVSNFVYSASGASTDTVIVDGRVLMSGGEVRTVDERSVLERAQASSARFQALADEWESSRVAVS